MTKTSRLFVSPSQKKGQHYESLALEYLSNNGLQFITQNFHSKFGEIDLIMNHQQTLVFIEVRYRANAKYGYPEETINSHKQKKIIATAKLFLLSRGLYDKVDCRFDILAIMALSTKDRQEFHWIKSAFQ